MSASLGAPFWRDPAWRRALSEQRADALRRLRLLLERRVAWQRHWMEREPLEGLDARVVSDAQADAALRAPSLEGERDFYRTHGSVVEAGRAIRELEAQLAERSAVMSGAGTPFPLDRLAELFGLRPIETDTLALAHALDVDSGFARLCAYAQDDAVRRFVTPELAVALLGTGDVLEEECFLPTGSLFRHALLDPAPVRPDSGLSGRALRPERRISWYLLAVDDGPEEGCALTARPGGPTPAELRPVAEAVARVLARPHGVEAPVVSLVGRRSGHTAAVAWSVARSLAMALHACSVSRDAEVAPTAARLRREAALRRSLLLFEVEGDDAQARRTLEVVERLGVPSLVASTHAVALDRPALAVYVPEALPESQRALWSQALGSDHTAFGAELDELAHHFPFDPETIVRVAAAARSAASLRGGRLDVRDVRRASREIGGRRMDGLAERIAPSCAWDDIVLPPDARTQLEEIVAQVRHRGLVYDGWRFRDRVVRGSGITALFAGPSGTGKTMAAEVVARALDLDLYRIDLAGVVDKYIGETEKNLRRVFDAAEECGGVLFFDEADALFGKRTDVRDSHDRYANIEIDYLLQRMESYRGVAILATNRRTSLDRAFLRRLRFLVDLPFPGPDTRLRIWQLSLPQAAPTRDIDFAALARLEIPGGNIRSIAINAAFLAADDGKVITMSHLMHAAAREYAKLDKQPTEQEFGGYARTTVR